MRVDKWLSAVNVVKRRTIATDMLKSGVVLVNEMKECKEVFKKLEEEQYISATGSLTMKGVMEAKVAEEMFKQ